MADPGPSHRARFRVVKAVHFTRAPKKYEKIGAPKFGKIKLLVTVIVALFSEK